MEKNLLLASLGLCVAGALLVAVRTFRFLSVMQQHANAVNMRIVTSALERYREEQGEYPASLSMLPDRPDGRTRLDEYGNPYLYEVAGDAFILVSPGSDGQSDGADDWALRESPPLRGLELANGARSTCGEPKRDLVGSDLGVHQACAVK